MCKAVVVILLAVYAFSVRKSFVRVSINLAEKLHRGNSSTLKLFPFDRVSNREAISKKIKEAREQRATTRENN